MTKTFNAWARLLGVFAILSLGIHQSAAFVFLDNDPLSDAHKWASGTINYQTDFPALGPFVDGSANFQVPFAASIGEWDALIYPLNLNTNSNPGVSKAAGSGLNVVWFANRTFDMTFPTGVLAVAYTTTSTAGTANLITEVKIIFNEGYNWDSYRGPYRRGNPDFKRVALHELGHTLGFDHPDAYGQSVGAIMNATVSDLDGLQQDEALGAQALYGGGAGPGIPPRSGGGTKRKADIMFGSGGGSGGTLYKDPSELGGAAVKEAPIKVPYSIVLEGENDKKFLITVDKPLYTLSGSVAGDVKTRYLQYSADGGVTWNFLPGYNPVDKTFDFYYGMPAKGKSKTIHIKAVATDESSAIRTVVFLRKL